MKLRKTTLLSAALPDAFVKDGKLHISREFLSSIDKGSPVASYLVILDEDLGLYWGLTSEIEGYRHGEDTHEEVEEAVKLLKANFPAIFEPKTKGQTIQVEIPYTA